MLDTAKMFTINKPEDSLCGWVELPFQIEICVFDDQQQANDVGVANAEE